MRKEKNLVKKDDQNTKALTENLQSPKIKERRTRYEERRKDRPVELGSHENPDGVRRINPDSYDDATHVSGLLNSAHRGLMGDLLSQLTNLGIQRSETEVGDKALAYLHELDPKTIQETLLGSQMYGAHNAMVEFTNRALHSTQSDTAQRNASIATRFGNLWCRQAETLMKLRGQTGKQTMRVEHVTVEAGGQAIVGNMGSTGGGDGVPGK